MKTPIAILFACLATGCTSIQFVSPTDHALATYAQYMDMHRDAFCAAAGVIAEHSWDLAAPALRKAFWREPCPIQRRQLLDAVQGWPPDNVAIHSILRDACQDEFQIVRREAFVQLVRRGRDADRSVLQDLTGNRNSNVAAEAAEALATIRDGRQEQFIQAQWDERMADRKVGADWHTDHEREMSNNPFQDSVVPPHPER